jgi:nucleoside triphosphate diphosphatase
MGAHDPLRDESGTTIGEKFERAVAIMHRLRAPGGCPWDREQTFDSIKPFTIEETYEVIEAIDLRDWQELPGELGDLLLQVLFYAEMAQEDGKFSIADVLDRLSNKLVGRHPHVFGDVQADTPAEVLRNWEALKAREKQADPQQREPKLLLDTVSRAMPALLEAAKISHKAADVGFDWPHIAGLFEKLEEETRELRHEIAAAGIEDVAPRHRGVAGSKSGAIPEAVHSRLEDEVGDLFFVLVNIARYLGVDAESALRRSNAKFRRRFDQVERSLREQGTALDSATLDEMEAQWQQAKQAEKRG